MQPLRVHAREDVLDAAILAAGIHRLEDDKYFVLVLGKEFFLQFLQFLPQLVKFDQ